MRRLRREFPSDSVFGDDAFWCRRKTAVETVEFDDVTVIASTAKALRVRIGERELWVPKSQIYGGTAQRPGQRGTLEVMAWLLRQENWAGVREEMEERTSE